MNTKHIFKITWFLSALFCLYYILQSADVSATVGACANCHVMHAQEQGTPKGGQNKLLVAATCLGCHGNTSTADATTPTVDTDGDFVSELAGGNFRYLDIGLNPDRKGHNVNEAVSGGADTVFLGDPPGYDQTNFDPPVPGDILAAGSWAGKQIRCAGTYGCHGEHVSSDPMTDMSGAHHKNLKGSWCDGTTIGKSFRFLMGVQGLEDDDYEDNTTVTSSVHNVYYGENRGSDAVSNTATISYFCAECHGNFHSADGDGIGLKGAGGTWGTDWVRHPVDFLMPTSTEYDSYDTYVLTAPVATNDSAHTAATTVAIGTYRIVMCLSCHKSHASEFDHMLRFDDQKMIAGNPDVGDVGTGCFGCHRDKDNM